MEFADRIDGSLAPLAFLVGTWRGSGTGTWPTSGPFSYDEELIVDPGGGGEDFAFLVSRQRAWDRETGETIHVERGCWRVHPDGAVDVTLAHPIGVTEIAEGTVADGVVTLGSTHIGIAERGLPVRQLRRRYRFDGDSLSYEIDLAAGEVEILRHLEGTLRPAPAG